VKLPNAANSVVPMEKITRYLLDPTNPRNGGKPGFFSQFGFTAEDWRIFARYENTQ